MLEGFDQVKKKVVRKVVRKNSKSQSPPETNGSQPVENGTLAGWWRFLEGGGAEGEWDKMSFGVRNGTNVFRGNSKWGVMSRAD